MGYSMSGNFGATSEPSTAPLKAFTQKVQALFTAQSAVDRKIAAMPSGPDKSRLMKARDDNRGVFSTYILPVYKKVRSAMSEYSSAFSGEDEDETMGVIPLVAWGVVAGLSTLVGSATVGGYLYSTHAKEMKILNDPAFSASQKASLLKGGGIGGALSDAKTIVLVLAGLFIVWQGAKFWKAR